MMPISQGLVLQPLHWYECHRSAIDVALRASTPIGFYEIVGRQVDGGASLSWRGPDGRWIEAPSEAVAMQEADADRHRRISASIDQVRTARDAVLIERERCAAVAEGRRLAPHPKLEAGAEMNAWWSGQQAAAADIAAGIRSGSQPQDSAS